MGSDELIQALRNHNCTVAERGCSCKELMDVLVHSLENQLRFSTDPVIHRDHHEYIQLQIDKERRKLERRQQLIDGVKQHVIGWTIVVFIGAILTSISTFGYKLYMLLKP